MKIEMTNEQKERLVRAIQGIKDIALTLEALELSIDNNQSLSEQINQAEEITNTLNQISNDLSIKYGDLSSIIDYELSPIFTEELSSLRQRYLEEETDTPREAADNIAKYLENPGDTGLLQSALKYLMTQVPPLVEEIEIIPFETARINDPNLLIDTERIEIEGVNGEIKISYEVITEDSEEVRKEISREVIKEPVTQVIRVGTKPAEVEEPIDPIDPIDPVEPVEPEEPEE